MVDTVVRAVSADAPDPIFFFQSCFNDIVLQNQRNGCCCFLRRLHKGEKTVWNNEGTEQGPPHGVSVARF